jgi:uncharacterized membrane protein (DUF485 family)
VSAEFTALALSFKDGPLMKLNGRIIFPLLLACFWVFLAYRAFSNGDTTLAFVFLAVGAVITTWRLRRANA